MKMNIDVIIKDNMGEILPTLSGQKFSPVQLYCKGPS